MNIAPVSNYNNRTSFGMAFKKPSQEVNELFKDTLRGMSPKERVNFVDTVGQLIARAKSCPIDIEHTIYNDYMPHYGAKVGKNIYTYNVQKSTNKADSIIDTMERAIRVAENEHDINKNHSRLLGFLNG